MVLPRIYHRPTLSRGMGTAGDGAPSVEGNRIRCAESRRSVYRLQLHHVTGRNIAPLSVVGASVRTFGVSSQLGCFYFYLFILVSEDSHSLMGGSDVMNSGTFTLDVLVMLFITWRCPGVY